MFLFTSTDFEWQGCIEPIIRPKLFNYVGWLQELVAKVYLRVGLLQFSILTSLGLQYSLIGAFGKCSYGLFSLVVGV